jgi:regulation of enolase protein 1 (concanavalin A-like superfamily)
MLFDRSDVFVAQDLFWGGITAGDLDRDGDQDLVVTHTDRFSDWTPGGVEILRGNGNGTFAAPVRYQAGVDGPMTVVVGHFNGDTLLDVATGNRSWLYVDQNGPTRHYWDSLSVFPGLGDGRLAAAATFRLDTVNAGDVGTCPWDSSCYVDMHHSLKTSDVNGDGRTDLITSPGAIALNVATAANRAPTAHAGPDTAVDPDHLARLSVTITEPDWDWLQVEWREEATGRVVSHVPSFFYHTFTDQLLRATVMDVRGGSATDTVWVRIPPVVEVLRPLGTDIPAGSPFTIRWTASDNVGLREFDIFLSTDQGITFTPLAECTNLAGNVRSCVWRNPNPPGPGVVKIVATDTTGAQGAGFGDYRVVTGPGTPGGLPPGWNCGSVGQVQAAGTCSQSGGVFTIEGSGADIGGTADEFQFAGDVMVGNFSITARVSGIENVHPSTEVGIMIREDPWLWGSRHAAFVVTPGAGTAFLRRTTTDGATTSTAGPATTAPIWLKLVRTGNTIRAFYRKSITDAWTLLGSQTFTALANPLSAQLVVSSHVDGTLATGTFDNVVMDESEPVTSVDIGGSAAGATRSDTINVTIEGNGAGIWSTADAFRFRYSQWTGDGTITVRLRSLENTSTGAKAGVMFRESLAPGSKHVSGFVYAAGGVVLQLRGATNGASSEAARRSGTAPEWLRLTRVGNTFTFAASNNGVTWSAVGQTTVAMGNAVYVGLPVTSRVAGTLATAVFDDLWIRP